MTEQYYVVTNQSPYQGAPPPVHQVHHDVHHHVQHVEPIVNRGCAREVFRCGGMVWTIRAIIVFWLFVSAAIGLISIFQVWKVLAPLSSSCSNSTAAGLCHGSGTQLYCFPPCTKSFCDYSDWCKRQTWLPQPSECCGSSNQCQNVLYNDIFYVCQRSFGGSQGYTTPGDLFGWIFWPIIGIEIALTALFLGLTILFVVLDSKNLADVHEYRPLI